MVKYPIQKIRLASNDDIFVYFIFKIVFVKAEVKLIFIFEMELEILACSDPKIRNVVLYLEIKIVVTWELITLVKII